MAAATTMTEKMGGTTMGGFVTAVGITGWNTVVPTTPGKVVGLITPVVTPCSREGIQSRAGSSGEREHRETGDIVQCGVEVITQLNITEYNNKCS